MGVDSYQLALSDEMRRGRDKRNRLSTVLNAHPAIDVDAATGEVTAFQNEAYACENLVRGGDSAQRNNLQHAFKDVWSHTLQNRRVDKSRCNGACSNPITGQLFTPDHSVCDEACFGSR